MRGYLHDELNGTDKVHEELFDHVLLFLGHLIETVLFTTFDDLLRCQTLASVSVE